MKYRTVVRACVSTSLVVLSTSAPAFADPPNDAPTSDPVAKDIRSEVPIVAYAYGASGVTAGSVGVQAYGVGLAGAGQRAIGGGGGSVWGSPVDRLTLIADGARDIFGNFAPSAAAVVRIVGLPNDGFSLGALGKYKVDGFAVGPKNEMESEIEAGLLVSYVRYGWHMHANAIGGRGLGDGGEMDTETRVRIAHDLGDVVRLGLDGQARVRVAGDTKLPGNRTWDFAGGPQLLVGTGNFFGALTAGPATMGMLSGVGWTGVLSFGGATL